MLQRSFAAEALTCLACSPDGAYLAAGGASGTLYLWEVGSGRLLRAWAAHYKVSVRRAYVCGDTAAPGWARGALRACGPSQEVTWR